MLNYMKWKLKQIMKCITLNNLQKTSCTTYYKISIIIIMDNQVLKYSL